MAVCLCARGGLVREEQRGKHKNYSSQKKKEEKDEKWGKPVLFAYNLQLVSPAWVVVSPVTCLSICRSDGISCDE